MEEQNNLHEYRTGRTQPRKNHNGPVAVLLIAQIACIAATKTNSAIHDLLAGTVAVDIASQQIFRSSEELLEYTKKIHAERANRSAY